jgi:acetolactate decarboxylase
MLYRFLSITCLLLITGFQNTYSQAPAIIGAMKRVMWSGELQGNISLDTIAHPHTYGMGPLAYLKGELLLWDGTVYSARVRHNGTAQIDTNRQVTAPFFAYSTVEAWSEVVLPDSVRNASQLEQFMAALYPDPAAITLFRLEGIVDSSVTHIVNLPEGTTVRSPQDAHQGKVSYTHTRAMVQVLGFYSRNHQGIFTHHDSFLHMHLVTHDRSAMGHVDALQWTPGAMKLFVPQE